MPERQTEKYFHRSESQRAFIERCETIGIPIGWAPIIQGESSGTVVADTGKTLCNGTTKPANLISVYRLVAHCKEANVEEIMQ
jgi:hypothetical protein